MFGTHFIISSNILYDNARNTMRKFANENYSIVDIEQNSHGQQDDIDQLVRWPEDW